MNKKERMYERIREHGENMKVIFHLDNAIDPIVLSKKLFRLERRMHYLTTLECNGDASETYSENETTAILKSLNKLLDFKAQNIPVFVNGDCRGYALKIKDDYIRDNNLKIERDWGGYGLIAPDFKEIK